MKLVQTWLSARRHLESSFHHCGGSVKLVQACLCARKYRESSFHHYGGAQKKKSVLIWNKKCVKSDVSSFDTPTCMSNG